MSDDDFDGVDTSPDGWEEIGHLDAGQYWRLEAHQLYIDKAKQKAKITNLMHQLLTMEKRLLDIKINNMSQEAISMQQSTKDKKDGYLSVKKAIEKEIGFELKDCVIDDATYAIRREIGGKIESDEKTSSDET